MAIEIKHAFASEEPDTGDAALVQPSHWNDFHVVSGAVAKAGDAMTGPLALAGPPVEDLHAATKAYVDGLIDVLTLRVRNLEERELLGEFVYNAATAAPPNDGQVRLNNAAMSAATMLWLSHMTDSDVDVSLALANIVAPMRLLLQDKDNSNNYITYTVTGPPTDAGSHHIFPVTFINSAGSIINNQHVLIASLPEAGP